MQSQVVEDYSYGYVMLESIRNQMERYRDHGIEPRFILMSGQHYEYLANYAESTPSARHNMDKDTVNGLPVVICENMKEPVVTTSPGELMKHGLL
jgi:hypothetical protein